MNASKNSSLSAMLFRVLAAMVLLAAGPAAAQRVSLGDLDAKLGTIDLKVDVLDAKADQVLEQTRKNNDGVVAINQDCAENTGCLAGDAPGFPVTVGASGSYRLTSDLVVPGNTSAISIGADNVSIDLNGFAVVGTATISAAGINGGTTTRKNISVSNGTVRNWAAEGVLASVLVNSRFDRLRISDNGASGIRTGPQSAVTNCDVRNNALDGVDASTGNVIAHCTAEANGQDGIDVDSGSVVSGSTSQGNGSAGITGSTGVTITGNAVTSNGGHGIAVGNGSIVRANTSTQNGGDGINAGAAVQVVGNTARTNAGNGIEVNVDCLVQGNSLDNNTGEGILAAAGISDTRIDGNHVTDHAVGIRVLSGGNLIIRNSAAGNTTDYAIAAGNSVGPIVTDPAATTNPWANFDF